ncbi:MAG: dipeptidase [Candidatus Omnitrophica bacterium]|nr:dipeptidase [Candidatus Omnitrophota bacterium]MCM8807644.1 dipeptidase [Candidatus Omnitrophota bacterium]
MNKEVKKCWDIALNILKPSRKEFEKGIKIHKESIVWDAYGFAPLYYFKSKEIEKIVKDGASEIEMLDLKEEITQTGYLKDFSTREEFLKIWETAGVTCITQNAGEESNLIEILIKRLARFIWLTDLLKPSLRKITSPEEVIVAKKANAHCLCLTTNGVPLTNQFISVEDEIKYIKVFYQLGVRMMHLTYNRRNLIGDGCMEEKDGGLSDFGKVVVKEMNKIGIIVDVAHSSLQTCLDACKISSAPVVVSHSACMSLWEHPRNKTDKVISKIADTGGFIGICCIPFFLGRTCDINAFLDHIVYVVKKFGSEYVAIGTDIAYQPPELEIEYKKLNSFMKKRGIKIRNKWNNFWRVKNKKVKISEKTKSLVWTNFPLFTVGLVQRGLSEKEIRNILGENIIRVMKMVREVSQYKEPPILSH